MLLSPDVVLALLYAAQAQDQYALLNVLASSVLVYALCSAAMRRARQLAGGPLPLQLNQHDALIQGGQGLMLSLYGAALQLPAGSPGRRELEQVLDEGDRWLAHSRQAVQRQRQSDSRLEQQLLELPERAGWPAQVAYSVSVQGATRALPVSVQQACLQVVQAMLESALPQGRQLEVELCFGWDLLRLRVRHDGSATTISHPLDSARLAGLLPRSRHAALQVWSGASTGVELSLQFGLVASPAARPVHVASLCWHALRRRLYPF
ncbi:hypothetical protein GTP23_02300 [Pseudoduganella sp. FT93W]|uniref:Histidine kinase n=1 Tax=Duganella fentianensis TaxID=2692177 RepID=A0A845HSI7_9BURK|nr:hypothetical protein [Duganella fentianensis]MYN43899.1 hypothetical protein [Duganella fentianensis]